MASFDTYSDEKATELDTDSNDSRAPLLWSSTPFQSRFHLRSWRFWGFVAFTHFLVAVLASIAAKTLTICSCADDERIPSFLSSIDRSFHTEIGNSAGGLDPASKETYNNFTVSTEIGGDQIEDWWHDLGVYTTPILVPEKYADDFDFDPEKHAFVKPDDPGYAPGDVPYAGYPTSIEVMHKLHCLNMMRQAAYFNHKYYRSIHHRTWKGYVSPNGVPLETVTREHLGHCVDVLRQSIMCDADISLVPYLKGRSNSNDWKRRKQCRSFEAVRDFVGKHQWRAATPSEFVLDDHHSINEGMSKRPKHSIEELWRGF